MTLKELKLSGFKSFSGKTELVFDDGITGVIGPNGSGKSNVADAIRWVLGEQSTKTLRGLGGTDVIFSGSASKARRSRASVELTFDNSQGRFALDAAEVTITRQVDRSGTSQYLINGDHVRLADLVTKLTEAGIGPKSYAVISQGTVDRYLMATAADRRELFDEATGVKPLKMKLAKAGRVLARAEQMVHELTAVLTELKPRLNVLRRQVELQQKREGLLDQHRELQSAWYQQELTRATNELIKAESTEQQSATVLRQAKLAREDVEASVISAISDEPEEPVTMRKKNLGVINVQDLLKRCRDFIEQALAGSGLSIEQLNDLNADLTKTIDLYDVKEKSSEQAIKPSRQQFKDEMGQVREQELGAEREHSTNKALLVQAKEDHAELQQEIKRELGSVWLEDAADNPDNNMPGVEHGEVQQVAAQLAAIGEIDPLAIKEHEEVSARYHAMSAQLEDSKATFLNTEKLILSLQGDIKLQFEQQLATIAKLFQHYFHQLFGGGKAQIVLQDDGVDLLVDPPGKKLQHVQALSGGEKALTSLSLLLAIVKVQQPPFIVLDEVDAALDEANSERFVNVLHELAAHTQTIIITHNRSTMTQAKVLYGVTMNADGESEVYSVKLDEVAQIKEGLEIKA